MGSTVTTTKEDLELYARAVSGEISLEEAMQTDETVFDRVEEAREDEKYTREHPERTEPIIIEDAEVKAARLEKEKLEQAAIRKAYEEDAASVASEYAMREYYYALNRFLLLVSDYREKMGSFNGTNQDNYSEKAELVVYKYYGGSRDDVRARMNRRKAKMREELDTIFDFEKEVFTGIKLYDRDLDEIIKDFIVDGRRCVERRKFYRRHVDKALSKFEGKKPRERFPKEFGELEYEFKKSLL